MFEIRLDDEERKEDREEKTEESIKKEDKVGDRRQKFFLKS